MMNQGDSIKCFMPHPPHSWFLTICNIIIVFQKTEEDSKKKKLDLRGASRPPSILIRRPSNAGTVIQWNILLAINLTHQYHLEEPFHQSSGALLPSFALLHSPPQH